MAYPGRPWKSLGLDYTQVLLFFSCHGEEPKLSHELHAASPVMDGDQPGHAYELAHAASNPAPGRQLAGWFAPCMGSGEHAGLRGEYHKQMRSNSGVVVMAYVHMRSLVVRNRGRFLFFK